MIFKKKLKKNQKKNHCMNCMQWKTQKGSIMKSKFNKLK